MDVRGVVQLGAIVAFLAWTAATTGCVERVITDPGDETLDDGDGDDGGDSAETGIEPPAPDLPPEPPEPESCFFCDPHEYCIWFCDIPGGYHGHTCTLEPDLGCPEGYVEESCAFPADLSCMEVDP